MHEAKTRLSALVKAVVEQGETVILQRNGVEVAEIIPRRSSSPRRLAAAPELAVAFASGFDPAEPASGEEWPEDAR